MARNLQVQRTLPGPEDIVTFAAYHGPYQLAAIAGLTHDLLDRCATFRQAPTIKIRLRYWERNTILSPACEAGAAEPLQIVTEMPELKTKLCSSAGEQKWVRIHAAVVGILATQGARPKPESELQEIALQVGRW